MRKRKTLWLTRGRIGYEIWQKKPKFWHGYWYGPKRFSVCIRITESLGLKLKNGGIAKIPVERMY